ncbi:hypothetical protein Bca52824_036249 [Brassica carinata]|uniref:Uncharacterized protein n=1 Tax=Brassica carinata TaxID=52824 RepID=A0A8X7V2K1_BRACI|nr:hypothetical protein Bca52824_036249 [Brassica carinata]
MEKPMDLHKIFSAVAMGIALIKLIPAFGIWSPLSVGIGIGINATSQGVSGDWTYVIAMSIACGVLCILSRFTTL